MDVLIDEGSRQRMLVHDQLFVDSFFCATWQFHVGFIG